MTEYQEWQKRVKKDPFGDEPFTEEHKRRVIETVQRISQNPAPKRQTIWLKRIIPTIAVSGSLLAAVWWFLPGTTELSPDQPDMVSMSESTLSTESTAESTDSEPYSMKQKEMNKDAAQNDENMEDSLYKDEQSKLRISDQELWLQNVVKEADLIAGLKITNTNSDGITLQAEVEQIIVTQVNEVPNTLNINISESINNSDIPLAKEDRVVLFLKKTEQSDTYNLTGETQDIYVISENDLVSSIETSRSSLTIEDVPYNEFIEHIKALADN